jgi:hypothetical protein
VTHLSAAGTADQTHEAIWAEVTRRFPALA